MGWPGTGVELRVGWPGRGGCACPGEGRAVCCCKRATMSARGGTTGRAAGWPARFGLGVAGRKGMEGAGPPGASTAGGAAARAEGAAGLSGAAGGPGGIGWRGPVRICPGRGDGGAGRAGTPPVRTGGCRGALPPVAKGGRMGAGLERDGSSTAADDPFSDAAAGASGAGGGTPLAAVGGCSRTDVGAASGCSSIVSGSATATAGEVFASCCAAAGAAPPCTRWRISSAMGSSMELECVFFSVTPSPGSISRTS